MRDFEVWVSVMKEYDRIEDLQRMLEESEKRVALVKSAIGEIMNKDQLALDLKKKA